MVDILVNNTFQVGDVIYSKTSPLTFVWLIFNIAPCWIENKRFYNAKTIIQIQKADRYQSKGRP